LVINQIVIITISCEKADFRCTSRFTLFLMMFAKTYVNAFEFVRVIQRREGSLDKQHNFPPDSLLRLWRHMNHLLTSLLS